MTATMTRPSLDSGIVSLGGSDFEGLPDAEPIVDLPESVNDKPDTTPDNPVPAGHCQTCGEPIIREPGARGRLPKYHPDCRPLRAASGEVSSARGKGRNTRAEAEAEAIVAALQKQIVRACVMLSVVDRFDAYCVMVALPNVSDNLKSLLARNDKWRKEFMALGTGGSVIGLVISILMMMLPIAAHHGLLGKGQVAKLLVEMPFTLMKIQERLKEGTEALTKMMAEQLKQAQEANRQNAQQSPTAGSGAA